MMRQGRRELALYTSNADAALRRLDAVRAGVETHRVEADVEWDTFWGMYRGFCQAAARPQGEEE
jgi:hypothetical protein